MTNVEQVFKKCQTILSGHFIGRSRRHLPKYFDADTLLLDHKIASRLGEMMAHKIFELRPEVLVSPAGGAFAFLHHLALALAPSIGDESIVTIFADKSDGEFGFSPTFSRRLQDKRVVLFDDVINQGGTVNVVADLIRSHGGQLRAVVTLCNRGSCTAKTFGVENLFSLYDWETVSYESADSCPMCKKKKPINTDYGHGEEYLASLPSKKRDRELHLIILPDRHAKKLAQATFKTAEYRSARKSGYGLLEVLEVNNEQFERLTDMGVAFNYFDES